MRRSNNRKCRLWWPTHLSSLNQLNLHSYAFLFGWFISSSEASFDIVVAFACDESALLSMTTTHTNLERVVQGINRKMPVLLQDKSKFSLLGYYAADCSSNGKLLMVRGKGKKHINYTDKRTCLCADELAPEGKCGRWRCGCHKLDVILEQCRTLALEDNIWAQIVCDNSLAVSRKVELIPKVHHIHRKGEAIFQLDVHVVFYGIPVFGGHHYSLGFKSSSDGVTNHCKKPEWVKDLNRKQPYLDLDAVILSINTANAAKVFTEAYCSAKRSRVSFHFFCMFSILTWQLLAVLLASFSTIFYVVLQSFHVLSHVSQSYIYVALEKVFCNTCKNLEIRCCQLLYWPVFLKDYGLRSQSCVEYAEKAAFHKHSMWTSLVVDLLLGNFLGIILWCRAREACAWISVFSENATNYLLRTGCVWLMGNPAGFKLNTELAGVLGTISLIAIQIWSTIWWLLGLFLIHLIKVVAVFGSLFGLTAAAALIIDTISLATTHVSTLQWLLTLLYSWQIQAVDALWRLFRGRKWNPLRQRLDSYAYSVEQHVVGSLLFTPLLLLLPTTSLFYIFFTIMKTTISFVCIAIQFGISIIHATPYIKIFIWFVRRKRFPCGLWFDIVLCQRNATNSSEVKSAEKTASGSENSLRASCCRSTVLVSFLHSNFLNLRQVVWPHYRNVFSDVSRSSIALSAYGILTGKRTPSAPKIGLPPTLPWLSIPYKEYWRLCHEAVLACKQDCICQLHR
ncbi:phosphatidylinositol N-acetylglucosaminyltransferase subunit GPI1 isoform X1 [Nicotiana sylvestris]|uniref:Phosphatidylinositol N-acetylglucosaminyltransferase subunit GPI1 isoform X1 n=1 Tax=Nicotiana sylvestris TaxID=4096 RepID=A0A1U7YQW0_NICSY|nr:PREDICTED: phosphatidylinositol N-acetylglucosaminyltransferase subunit GPI1 isoform X1 [Nicotiana sylvestris]